ncbi:MAG TPA: RING finger domain-containing protein [Waddliaceae bacterium]
MSTITNNVSVSFYTGPTLGRECPITREPLVNPVITSCGHIFSKDALKSWLVTHLTCPICRRPLDLLGFPLTIGEEIVINIQAASQTAFSWLREPATITAHKNLRKYMHEA